MKELKTSGQVVSQNAVFLLFFTSGMKVPRKVDGSVDAIIEMAPRFAFDAAEVKVKIHKIEKIKAGDKVYLE
jgi:hypothetical protein